MLTFGHRNVQGLAQRPDGSLWSAEHGPDRDDEINRLFAGGDYGWNPVPGYNESVPMTDQGLPGTQIEARWRSGFPTLATSGIAWVRGKQVGRYRGIAGRRRAEGLAPDVHALRRRGHFVGMRTPPALRRFGRLRSVTSLPNGDLLVTTSNGDGTTRCSGSARTAEVSAPAELRGAEHDRRQPDHEGDQRQPRHPLGVRHEPARGDHEQHQPQQHEQDGHPPGATFAVPRSRNSTQAIPPMPTNPHGDTFDRATRETLRERATAALA